MISTPGIDFDEGIRTGKDLSEFKPAFQDGGRITAGNASQLSDGAAAVLVSKRSIAEEQGWPVLAKIKVIGIK